MKKLSVLYVCPDPGLGGSTRSLIQMIESLRESVDPTVLLPREELAAPAMRDLGIPVFVIPFSLLHESPGILSYFLTDAACERKISKTLSGKKIDLIHTNCSSVTIGESLSRRLKVPHVWHIREFLDLDFNFDVTLGIPRLQKKINRADARIAV